MEHSGASIYQLCNTRPSSESRSEPSVINHQNQRPPSGHLLYCQDAAFSNLAELEAGTFQEHHFVGSAAHLDDVEVERQAADDRWCKVIAIVYAFVLLASALGLFLTPLTDGLHN